MDMTGNEIIAALEEIRSTANQRVSDWPGPTCSKIDAALASLKPLQREATRLYRYNAENLKEDDGLEAFVSDVCDLVDNTMPEAWEDIRNENDRLRTSLGEALELLSEIRIGVGNLIGKIPFGDAS